MSLRVLLADDSADLKKAIQLSLQDFGVELRSVNIGTDALGLCKSFQPDIVFADVLLQKKNGYEVCKDIKTDPETKQTPVVLLWSGFMEIDKNNMQACGADASLEKPFEAEQLRQITKKFVAKTSQENPFASFIQLPDLPQKEEWDSGSDEQDFIDQSPANWNVAEDEPALQAPAAPDLSTIDENEDFSHIPISQESSSIPNITSEESDSDGQWENQKIGKFQLDISEESENFEGLDGLEIPKITEDLTDTSFLWNEEEDSKVNIPESLQFNIEKPEEESVDPSSHTEIESIETQTSLNPNSNNPSDSSEEIIIPDANEQIDIIAASEFELESPTPLKELHSHLSSNFEPTDNHSPIHLSSQRAEEIFREEVRVQVQTMLKNIVPEIAKKAIQEEIDRLLENSDG